MPRNLPPPEHVVPLLGSCSNTKHITHSLFHHVDIDPTTPGTIIRYALVVKILLNLFMGTSLAFYPTWFLKPVLSDPSSINHPATFTVCQWTGAIILATTVQVAMILSNTRGVIECRKLVYLMLVAGECCLILLFLYQASKRSDTVGFQRGFLLVDAFMFGLHMMWRLYCLIVKPGWFGRYHDVRK